MEIDDAIEILTNMYIKEHIEDKDEIVTMKKKDLIRFSIKLLKKIKNC